MRRRAFSQRRGTVFCQDAATGKVVYSERLTPNSGQIWASPVLADGNLYYVSKDAGPDESTDAILLFGPLYHLTDRADRLAALREARRVLRPGGVLVAAAISRFASALDGLRSGYLDDAAFAAIGERDLADGQHRNSTNHPAYFTTAFFHHPDELRREVADAGLTPEHLLAVAGPAWLRQDFDAHWGDPGRRERLLGVVRRLEADPAVLGTSAHILAVARK